MVALAKPFVRTSTSNEWYTPFQYVEAARLLMGTIDLDPASSSDANMTIRATVYYDAQANGLSVPWSGRVWLNPPYGTTNGQSNQGIWTRRCIYEYQVGNVKEAILLITAATDMKWFQVLWNYPLCFVDHGIYFYRPQENDEMKHGQGSCVAYLGHQEGRFTDIFRKFGPIMRRVDKPCEIAPLSLWEVSNV
jgi:hypothetical protein